MTLRAVVLAGSLAAGGAGASSVANPGGPAETPAVAAPGAQPVSPILTQVLSQLKPASKQAANDSGAPEAGLFGRYALQNKGVATAAKGPAALVPALGYAMEQLDPASFAVLRPVPVGGSGPMLRTGDVFVLQFSTNLPGQVRLENIDPAGKTVDLGMYTVLVDQLNRLPRDKGIQLQGQPGVERLRFHFYPCLPAEAAGKPWAADFKGRLPSCPSAPPALVNAIRSLGTVTPRALVNLSQPDANVAFAASADYQPGEITLMEARIRHESRGHGR